MWDQGHRRRWLSGHPAPISVVPLSLQHTLGLRRKQRKQHPLPALPSLARGGASRTLPRPCRRAPPLSVRKAGPARSPTAGALLESLVRTSASPAGHSGRPQACPLRQALRGTLAEADSAQHLPQQRANHRWTPDLTRIAARMGPQEASVSLIFLGCLCKEVAPHEARNETNPPGWTPQA